MVRIARFQDEKVSEKLREATGNAIEYGLDTISEGGSVQKVQAAFGDNGGHLVCLLFDLGEPARKDVKTEVSPRESPQPPLD